MSLGPKLAAALFTGAVFLSGIYVGKWGQHQAAASAGAEAKKPLYYRCPMHPSYHSDKPGVSPCCNMALEAVYAEDAAGQGTPSGDLSNAIHVTAVQQQLMGVQYGIVAYAPVARSTSGPAQIRVDETRLAHIQTKLEGNVDHLYVSAAGEKVTQGQPLLTIFHRRTYAMPQAQFLEALMGNAGMGPIPKSPAEAERMRLANGEALRIARQQLEMLGFTDEQIAAVQRAHQPLASIPVHSPVSGVITEFHVAVNQKISMEPLLTIADLSSLWAVADFSPADAAFVRPGQSATLTVPYFPEKVFHGTVQTALPVMDSAAHTVKVRVAVPNPDWLLKPEMFGQMELRVEGSRKRLTVPATAVIDTGRERIVFADLGGGYLEPRSVQTGERFGDRVEILQGLKDGNRIVTSGAFLLDSESRIRSRN
jgi:RND family efflux transporter MFP subunit